MTLDPTEEDPTFGSPTEITPMAVEDGGGASSVVCLCFLTVFEPTTLSIQFPGTDPFVVASFSAKYRARVSGTKPKFPKKAFPKESKLSVADPEAGKQAVDPLSVQKVPNLSDGATLEFRCL